MHLKSQWQPFPEPPIMNYHDFQFGLPNVVERQDYTLFVDAYTGERRSWKQFEKRVGDAATALASLLGLDAEKGHIVGILSENSMEYPTLVHAQIKIAVPIALMPSFSTPAETTALLKLAKVTHLFVSPKFLPLAREAAQKLGMPEERIFLLQGKVDDGRRSLGDMVQEVNKRGLEVVKTRPVKENTLAYLIFSSGTSGLPKAVMLSHRNLCASLCQVLGLGLEYQKIGVMPPTADAPAVSIAFLPMYHAMCLHNVLFRGLVSPTTFIVLPKWDINVFMDLVPKYKVTSFSIVPSLVHQIVHHPKFRKTDWSSVMSLGGGAAYLPWELRQKMLKAAKGVAFWAEGYGMSECSVSAMLVPPPGLQGGPKPGLTGVLLPNQEARIVREDMSECDWNEPGELLLKGGNVAMGYWDNPKATKETFLEGGWLRTGDRFLAKPDGGLYYVDRMKDTLKVSGKQVSPTEIEDTLLAHPSTPPLISDVVVAGVVPQNARISDEQVPRAWVVLTDEGKGLGAQEVVRRLDVWHKERLSKYKWLRGGFEVVEQIPKSPTGKVLRRKLQDDYRSSLRTQAKL